MRTLPVFLGIVLLVPAAELALPQFAQYASTPQPKSDQERPLVAIALVRSINTEELSYKHEHGSYGSWRILLSGNPRYFEGFLSAHGMLQGNPQFNDAPEILPGWNLRLNVHADGQGYDVLLEDKTDKHGYAVLSDERGVIRECYSLP